MGRAKITIPESELRRLYIDERWSPARIGKLYGCDAVTVRARIIESTIPLKSKSAAHVRFSRRDFSGTPEEKAYLLGFRYGDLNVYKPKGASETIVVRSHSTLTVQGELFCSLLERYGTITVSEGIRSTQMTCYLNSSFSFLLEKYPDEIREWLLQNKDLPWPFAAGYIDAEGTFGLNQEKGRFKVDSYDDRILADLNEFFCENCIRSNFRIIARQGENDYGWIWKKNLIRISVNEAGSLEKLVQHLKPYLQHAKRLNDANMVLQNIQERRLHGTVK